MAVTLAMVRLIGSASTRARRTLRGSAERVQLARHACNAGSSGGAALRLLPGDVARDQFDNFLLREVARIG